jgi:hypothetical protein
MDIYTSDIPREVIAEFISSPRGIRAFENVTSDVQSIAGNITEASFLTIASEPTLGNERIFSPDSGSFTVTDGGANGPYAIALKTLAVTPATYGSASKVAQVTVDANGRVTAAVDVTITPSAIGAAPTTRTITAGAGLTGGGDFSADRTLAVGAGTGIVVNADDVAAKPAGTYGSPTGTLARAIFATYTAATISNPPTQAEVQAVANALQDASRTLAALITDMKANGNLS